ncbi:podoplanin [Sander vitreus]
MNVQLLLLLALVGPFCAFTHASPTEIPPHPDDEITETVADIISEATEAPKEDLTVITGPPATQPAAAPEEAATEVPKDFAADVVTEAALPAFTFNTEEAVVETEAPAAAATAAAPEPEPLITDAPVVETKAPDESAEVEGQSEVTEAAKTVEEVLVEDNTEEGLSSGQVAGIVIGALLAVVILIAVVIAVVRRMGKYSP